MAIIATKDLCKIYRTETVESTVLDGISLTVEPGDFVALMGPSGCGKSTLLNILGLLDQPDAGEYSFTGERVEGLAESQRTRVRRGRIGFIFQSFNLIDELTVQENVELPLLYLRLPAAQRRQRVDAALERLQITPRRAHFPKQLSGGQQQRAAIARAVVSNPTLLLADEPTGNLDSVHGREVMDLLCELNRQGSTIVMVTHSQTDAARARRIIRLQDGHIATGQAA